MYAISPCSRTAGAHGHPSAAISPALDGARVGVSAWWGRAVEGQRRNPVMHTTVGRRTVQ